MDSNSNSTQQAEELESIQAIYCKPQEFNSWEAPEGQYVTIRFDFTLPPKKGVQRGGIHALLTSDYPLSSPTDMDVFCDNNSISASSLHSYKLKMEERAEALKGEPMLLDLLCFVQELFESSADINDSIHDCDKLQKHDSSAVSVLSSEGDELKILSQSSSSATLDDSTKNHVDISLPPSVFHTKPNTRSIEDVNPSQRCKLENEDSLVTTLLHLDHMRSKRNYVKLIQKWTLELGLNGRLLFYGRFIFIVLQGHPHQVKEYILRNKTMIVDVDSKGRPCKERMLSVLCEVNSEKYLTFKEFTTVDNISSFDDFSAMFQSFSMMDVFNEHIEPVCSVKSKKASLRK